MFALRLPVIAAAAVLSTALPALAIPLPPPTVCQGESYAVPYAGRTIPANIPAVNLRPNNHYLLPRTIESHDIQLRDGSGALVPTTVEAHSNLGYLVRPTRPLALGEATLSFLEECPPGQKQRLTTPVRNDRIRYTIAPASPLPTRIGSVSLRVVDYRWHPERPDRPEYAVIRVDLQPTPEMDAFREAVHLDLSFTELTPNGSNGGSIRLWPEDYPSVAPNVYQADYECAGPDGSTAGRKATRTYELTANLPGATEVIPSLTFSVELDCTNRPAPPLNDGGSDATVTQDAAAPVRHDSRGCSYAPATSPGPVVLLMFVGIVVALVNRRR